MRTPGMMVVSELLCVRGVRGVSRELVTVLLSRISPGCSDSLYVYIYTVSRELVTLLFSRISPGCSDLCVYVVSV
jgi:hypothetical protein